jgi:hypothetical protein
MVSVELQGAEAGLLSDVRAQAQILCVVQRPPAARRAHSFCDLLQCTHWRTGKP